MDDYESWIRSEIASAQAKVDDLQRALSVFLDWKSSQGRPVAKAPPLLHRAYPIGALMGEASGRRRASKNNAIFAAFERAGSSGLSQEEVQRVATEAGITSSANALRALCWSAKQAGRLISLAPGRYAIPQIDDAAPRLPDGGGDAASTRATNDRHREGDEGGGT